MQEQVTSFLHPPETPPAPEIEGWGSSTWPRAVVFDCDGLLVDSAACWHDAYTAATDSAGYRLDGLDLAALNGASVADAARRLREEIGAGVEEETLREALLASVDARRPAALPGAKALVTALAPRLPLAVASNGPAAVVASLLAHNEMAAAFTEIVSAEQVTAAKPAPDVYLEAARRLGVDGSDALAFEDSPRGVEAARAAGLIVVGVPSLAGQRLDADLVVRRLDDSRLLGLLGLDPAVVATDGRRKDLAS